MTSIRRWVFIAATLVTMVGCDHATKYVAKSELEGRAPRAVIGSLLDFRYVENTDVAFNMLRFIPEGARRPLLIAFGALAILALTVIMLRRSTTPLTRAAAVVLLAGALGNYLDRIFRGYVVDFIHVSYWPVFNVADICVAAGIALLAWESLFVRRKPTPQPA